MDDLQIPEVDRERIEAMVRQYRHQIENLYRIAYLQGQIESETKARNELLLTNAEMFAKRAGLL